MSAFFVSINRDGSAFDVDVANNMMNAIDHFGVDERQLVVHNNFAIGYQSFWTVPEEVSERQPLHDPQSGTWLVFYGRIDNREAVFSLLEIKPDSAISDAALMHIFLARFSDQNLEKIIGPFAFVLLDSSNANVLCARDVMGGRNLVHQITDSHVNIATNEMSLAAHPAINYRFNQERLGRLIAMIMPHTATAVLEKNEVLFPGNRLLIKDNVLENKAFYRADAAARIRLADDAAYAAEFKRLLSQAVKRRSRCIGPIGSMMSGGMDSVPISILMAQQLAEKNAQLTALSWVYNRFLEADERHYSTPVCQKFGIEQVCIECDDVWPKLDETTHVDPLQPFSSPYSEYHQALLGQAQKRGIRTLLTGMYGDLLYGHTSSVYMDLIGAGRWRDCWSEWKLHWQQPKNRAYLIKHGLLLQIPGVRRFVNWRQNRTELSSPILQDNINKQLFNQTPDLFEISLKASRPDSYRHVFSNFVGDDQVLGKHIEAKYSVERRHPFRDRDLCEFMMAIPSNQLSFKHVSRPIVRNAFKHEFGEELAARKDKTGFTAAINFGIDNDPNWRRWYESQRPLWQHYVKECNNESEKLNNGDWAVVQWRCGYYDYWNSVCYNRVANELGLINDDDSK